MKRTKMSALEMRRRDTKDSRNFKAFNYISRAS